MYEDVTHQGLLERMLGRVPDKMDKREGSVIFDTLSPTALELQFLYIELERILGEVYGDTASREFLIRRCKERGIAPYEATRAVLKGKFTPADVDVIGQRFTAGTMAFTVIDKLPDGEYRVQCEMPGSAGNKHLGTMIPVAYIERLETAELTELLIPGEDEEDTEDLRSRYFGSFNVKAFGGNRQDYLARTNAIPGVGSTKVTRVWNSDIRPAELIPSAAVKEWYQTVSPSLSGEPAAWLATIFSAAEQKKLTTGGTVLLTILDSEFGVASDALIQAVQQTIDPEENAGEGYGVAPVGHVVRVESAKAQEITVNTDIDFDAGYGWVNRQSLINEAISGYLLELRKSWAESSCLTVRISQIEARLLNITGILDIGNTKLNGVPDNLNLEKYEVPVFGGAGA